MSQHISRATSTSTVLVPQQPEIAFPSNAVYIRLLSKEECRRPDVIELVQNSKFEINEIYGIFSHTGRFIGAGADRSLAAETAIDSGCLPQVWLA